jgi:hypothetical protein
MDEVVITWINRSTSLADQPPQPSFQDHPDRHRVKAVHPTAWRWAGRTSQPPYWPKPELTLNHLRSKDQERPSQEAVDHRAGRTYENGPTRSTDLTYL